MNRTEAIVDAIARAVDRAGGTIADNFIHPAWTMDADEFIAWWGGTRLASIATVGRSGWPHASPLEVTLTGDRFIIPSFPHAVRIRDLSVNPRLVLTAWDDPWHAAIVYGRIDDVGASPLSARPTRIYAMRAPKGHHAYRR
jgi:hypothetical protein